ncbi:MAG: hypothetical protein ACPG6G_00660 [Flavobacteriaceae bacterium]
MISTVHPKNNTIIQNHTKGFVRQRGTLAPAGVHFKNHEAASSWFLKYNTNY